MSYFVYILPHIIALIALTTRSRFFEYIVVFSVSTLMLIRNNVGYDYENYKRILQLDLDFYMAPISNFLIGLARKIDFPNEFLGMLAIILFFQLSFLTRKRETRYILLTFLSIPIIYLDGYTISRQLCAFLFAAIAYQFFKAEKKSLSAINYIIAAGVHPSAAISPVLLLLERKNLTLKYVPIYVIAFGLLLTVIASYQSSKISITYNEQQSGLYFIALAIVTFTYSLFLKRKSYIVISTSILIGSVIIYFYGNQPLNRILMYFYIPFLFMQFNSERSNALNKIYFLTFLFVIFIIGFWIRVSDPASNYIPFKTLL